MAAPTIQASTIVVTPLSATTARVQLTAGNGSGRVIWGIAGESESVPAPVNAETYTPNAALGAGEQEIGGYAALGVGDGTSVVVSGLEIGADFTFAASELNGAPGAEEYNTGSATANPLAYQHRSPGGGAGRRRTTARRRRRK